MPWRVRAQARCPGAVTQEERWRLPERAQLRSSTCGSRYSPPSMRPSLKMWRTFSPLPSIRRLVVEPQYSQRDGGAEYGSLSIPMPDGTSHVPRSSVPRAVSRVISSPHTHAAAVASATAASTRRSAPARIPPCPRAEGSQRKLSVCPFEFCPMMVEYATFA